MSDRGVVAGIALKSAHRGPMKLYRRLSLNPAIGLEGFVASAHHSTKRQVTLISEDKWAAALRELGIDLPWFERRANFLVRGLDVARAIGRDVRIGTAVVSVLGELEPCSRMHDIHPGLYQALVPDCRGGVFGRIREAGVVRVDDEVVLLASEHPPSPKGKDERTDDRLADV